MYSSPIGLVALITVLAVPLYGQTSCNRNCPAAADPCERSVGRSVETGQCAYIGISGAVCELQDGAGVCSEGQCLPTECFGVRSYDACDAPLDGGSTGVCVEDLCITGAPGDECVKVGIGRINCCSQTGCAFSNGVECTDPLEGVTCDPTGLEPPGQPGQNGECVNGTCVAQTGPCAGVECPNQQCTVLFCDAGTGQCGGFNADRSTPCVTTAGFDGRCVWGQCTPH